MLGDIRGASHLDRLHAAVKVQPFALEQVLARVVGVQDLDIDVAIVGNAGGEGPGELLGRTDGDDGHACERDTGRVEIGPVEAHLVADLWHRMAHLRPSQQQRPAIGRHLGAKSHCVRGWTVAQANALQVPRPALLQCLQLLQTLSQARRKLRLGRFAPVDRVRGPLSWHRCRRVAVVQPVGVHEHLCALFGPKASDKFLKVSGLGQLVGAKFAKLAKDEEQHCHTILRLPRLRAQAKERVLDGQLACLAGFVDPGIDARCEPLKVALHLGRRRCQQAGAPLRRAPHGAGKDIAAHRFRAKELGRSTLDRASQ